jgi:hypothetical protein
MVPAPPPDAPRGNKEIRREIREIRGNKGNKGHFPYYYLLFGSSDFTSLVQIPATARP